MEFITVMVGTSALFTHCILYAENSQRSGAKNIQESASENTEIKGQEIAKIGCRTFPEIAREELAKIGCW